MRTARLLAFVALIGLLLTSLLYGTLAAATPRKIGNPLVVLGTGVGTIESGILGALLPVFEQRTGYKVQTVAVEPGGAIALVRKGNVDLLLLHALEEEEKLVAQGYALRREPVMHDEFVVVGPPTDPARIKGAASAAVAFGRIAAVGAPFVSRGDKSGIVARESAIWKQLDLRTEGRKWYQKTGLGMAETLAAASAQGGYTLTDRGTFVITRRAQGLNLEILADGDPSLQNVYHVLPVNPKRGSKVNAAGARALVTFLLAKPAQEIIAHFGINTYGLAPFFSNETE